MSDLFIPPLAEWPKDLRVLYEERAGIKHFDGGLPVELAEAQALVEVWEARQA